LGILKFWVGPVPVAVLLRARHVKILLESNTNITKPWQYDIVSDWIGRGLLTSTSKKWHSRRKIITPTFHFSILKGYRDVFIAQGRIFIDQLEAVADSDRETDLFPFIKRCVLDIICETAMGTQLNAQTGENVEYCDAVATISAISFEYIRMPWLWLKPIWYASGKGFIFDQLVKLSQGFTLKVIQERRKLMEEEGLLGEFVGMDDEKVICRHKSVFIDMLLLQQAANNFTDEDIREEVDTFMFEGHDTTASAMGFTIWYLGQYPEYQKLVHAEIDEVFGDDVTRDPTENDIKRLSYLERCIKEGLRLMPSVPLLARTLSEDLHIEGVTLPKNLTVMLAPVLGHRDPEHWERAEDFWPDHFLPDKEAARHPFAYVPFSAGPRNCVGQKFAIAEEKTVLSWFFRRYSVESVEPFPGNRPIPELILKPSCGFPVRLFKR
ncbi:hypothetical protein PENTCL1PPCAC_15345, partial [Pristionchus entomophagus]